jgi:hypothetical protein
VLPIERNGRFRYLTFYLDKRLSLSSAYIESVCPRGVVAFRRATELNPLDAEAWFRLGNVRDLH